MNIGKNGLNSSKGGFFGGGRYTSTIGPFPKNIFVPPGSKVPVTDMSGYLRVFPGTFSQPTAGGYLQLGAMATGYGLFANYLNPKQAKRK